ncbi:Allantoinase [ANME-1 cluster archaeon GoMg2]|nr:Allantoinase [ANME-1 cluster archaeon GoMg2]
MKLHIKNGTVYDPANGIEGDKMDIFVADGKIVDETKPEVIIDATAKTVMPGGIDVHSHVATYGLNVTRFTFGFPTLNEIGLAYARMGYTHVNEPLMTLNTASYVHHELSGIPVVDTSASLVLSLYDIDKEIRERDKESVKNLLLFLLDLTKSIGVNLYDARVKYAKSGFFYRDISINKCLEFFSDLIKTESGNMPNMQLKTYPALLDEPTDVLTPFWLAHIGSGIDNDERYEAAKEILKKGVAVDLGIYCPSQNGDINMSIGYDIFDTTEKFISVDIGLEKPLIFSKLSGKKKQDKKVYYSLLFALEALEHLSSSSGCISFSTDSPNGCFFPAYPTIFAGLLDHDSRKELTNEELPRTEYSLYEFAQITRTNPARQLGLRNKGHLGLDADADIAIYDIGENTEGKELERRLSSCSCLVKGGEVVIKEGKLVNEGVSKKRFYFEIGDDEIEAAKQKQRELIDRICNRRSFRAEHLKVDDCFIQSY